MPRSLGEVNAGMEIRMRRHTVLTIVACLVLAAPLYAQEEQATPPDVDLPPEVVEEDPVEPAPLPEEPTPPPPAPPPVDDVNLNFPSMLDLTLGGIDGGSRGAPISVFDNPNAISIVTQEEISIRAPTDIGAALENTVGVMVQRTGRGQSSPFVRGLTGNQVLILVDGVRMTNATFRAGPNQYFNTIDPNSVERIEVIRGPGSVLYGGDAMGGVINVVTKSASLFGYDYAAGTTVQRFSSADLGYTGRLNVEGSIGSAGVFLGGGYGNYNNLDIGGTVDAPAGFTFGRQPQTSWRYKSADLKFNYRLTRNDEFVFGMQHYTGEDIFRTDRFADNRITLFDPQQRDLFYARWQGYDSERLVTSYQITASFHKTFEGTRDERNVGLPNQFVDVERRFTDEQTGLTAVFGSDLGGMGWLTYGADWYHDEVDASATDTGGDGNPNNDVAQFPNNAYYSRYGVFAQWNVLVTERLRAQAGGRFEHVAGGGLISGEAPGGEILSTNVDVEFQDWIGNIGLTYEVTDSLHLVGSISEGFRAPNLDDLVAINNNVFQGTQLPNPNLDPENSFTYEVGAKFNSPYFRAQTFVWWNDFQNQILRSIEPGGELLNRSNQDSFLQGVEFDGELLLTDQWSLYGNFWYTYGRNDVLDEPLSRIPPPQGIVGLRRRWNEGQNWFEVFAWIAGKQDRLSARDQGDENRIPAGGTPGFTTVNVRYGQMITDRQRLSLNLQNVFDEQYRVHGSGSDGPGINAILSYELLR